MTPNINDSFFNGQYQEVWRQIIPPGLTEAEVDFIEDIGQLQTGAKILDILCGYGRHALELAKRGYNVTAIDNAAEYIGELNGQAASLKLPVRGLQENIQETDFDDQYEAVICMGNSFAFFPETGLKAILNKLSKCLKREGKLIINTWMIAEIAIRHFRENEWHPMKDYKYGIENRFLFKPTRIESVHTIITKTGAVEELKAIDYIFSLSEMEKMLEASGFVMEAVYATPRKKKFMVGDGRAYIIATRQ